MLRTIRRAARLPKRKVGVVPGNHDFFYEVVGNGARTRNEAGREALLNAWTQEAEVLTPFDKGPGSVGRIEIYPGVDATVSHDFPVGDLLGGSLRTDEIPDTQMVISGHLHLAYLFQLPHPKRPGILHAFSPGTFLKDPGDPNNPGSFVILRRTPEGPQIAHWDIDRGRPFSPHSSVPWLMNKLAQARSLSPSP